MTIHEFSVTNNKMIDMDIYTLVDIVVRLMFLVPIIGIIMVRKVWPTTGSWIRTALSLFLAALALISVTHVLSNIITTLPLAHTTLAGPYMLGSFVALFAFVSAIYVAAAPTNVRSYTDLLAEMWRARDPYLLLLPYAALMSGLSLLTFLPGVVSILSFPYVVGTFGFMASSTAILVIPLKRLYRENAGRPYIALYCTAVIVTLALTISEIYFGLILSESVETLYDWLVLALSLAVGIMVVPVMLSSDEAIARFFSLRGAISFPGLPRVPKIISFFSHQVGLTHEQLAGRKILLEFEPSSRYEVSINAFIDEASYFGERIIAFTHKGGPIQDLLRSKEDIVIACMSLHKTTVRQESENELVLPIGKATQISMFLAKSLAAAPQQRFTVIFDNLSNLTIAVGFRRAYETFSRLLEITDAPRVTLLVLINPEAHDSKEVSAFRQLMGSYVNHGRNGLETIKVLQVR